MTEVRTLRALFADDELMARRRMRRLLEAMPDLEIVAECESGAQVLDALERFDVDVCFLDVRMGAIGGLEAADAAAELGVEVVLTTAHPEHAVAAFDRGAVDYVLKPVEEDRLALAVERVRQRLASASTRAPAPVERLALTVRGEVRLVAPGEISHALLDGALVTVFVAGEALLTELTLAELEAKLPAELFVRVHRRALLQLSHVARLVPLATGGYTAVTTSGHEVPVSRQAARGLRRAMR